MTKTLTLLASLAVAASSFGLTAADTGTEAGPACLWAGAAYPQGAQVSAGGSDYTCGSQGPAPYWTRGRAAAVSTVPNPGADSNPAGRFSAGARQPGTEYEDTCVGDQFIPGPDDVYQAVSDGRGGLLWKFAGPISQWTFDPGAVRPRTTRSSGLCIDGVLT
ncbi:MAG: hypothetical protein JWN03_451 [Nocardia sp.]|uniref:hypothetical protein n=1 Tax=Nocardia sp. TaxID=1821 RepID=UPI0026142BB2|nr:hypothetical protein [Nocardia sp.]MCU1640176.1 hypothetical protein [Nocardia sp.]